MQTADGPPQRREVSYLIADLPAHERPRERLLRVGAESLSDQELLAIILRSGPAGSSTLDLARELLSLFHHSLGELAAATPTELAQVKGIGPAKASELKATFALAARLATQAGPERARVGTPEQAADYLRESFRGKKQEELRALLLDNKNGLVRDELLTVGLLDRNQAHAREVFRPAIRHGAAKLILAHNHPSGDPRPSTQDIDCTRELMQASKVVGIELVDHLVLGDRDASTGCDYYSFRENGHF